MNKSYVHLISITLVIILITGCTGLFGGEEEEVLVLPTAIKQWAMKASASSAAGGLLGENRDDQSPFAATGESDVDECGDSLKAWVIEQEDDGMHWLELEFYDEVYVSQVRVKESWNPGSVAKIELKNDNEYVTMWEGVDNRRNPPCPGFFEVNYEGQEGNISKTMSPFKAHTIKITLNTDVEGWNEIDAVQLVGYNERWYLFNNTVFFE